MTPPVPEQLRALAAQLRALIDILEQTGPGAERDAAVREIESHLEWLRGLIERHAITVH